MNLEPFNLMTIPMSIRLLAIDLYRLYREVGELEDRIKNAPYQKRPELEDSLRKKRAERDSIRNALEGQKDDSKTRP